MGQFDYRLAIRQEDADIQKKLQWPTPKLGSMLAAFVHKYHMRFEGYADISKRYFNNIAALRQWLDSAFDKSADLVFSNNKSGYNITNCATSGAEKEPNQTVLDWLEDKWKISEWSYEKTMKFFEEIFIDALNILRYDYNHDEVCGLYYSSFKILQNFEIQFSNSINSTKEFLLRQVVVDLQNQYFAPRKILDFNGLQIICCGIKRYYIPDKRLRKMIIETLKKSYNFII